MAMLKNGKRIAALTSLMIASLTGTWAHAGELYGKVVGVTDGDTVTIMDDMKKTHEIRLASIDAPETTCHMRKPSAYDDACVEHGQHFGKTAKRYMSGMIYGKSVVVDVQVGSSYGREIGTIYFDKDGNRFDANYELVKAGLAWHYTHFASKYQSQDAFNAYADAQISAQKDRKGLWRDHSQTAPWDYREQVREQAAQPHITVF